MNSKGMTLLEVMAAIVIFALTATSIMKAASDHLRGIAILEELTFATWVANNRLQQAQVENAWPPQNNKKGSEDMAGKTWYWQQKVTETEDKDLRQVEILVSADPSLETISTSVVTFFANPRPAAIKL